MNKWNEQTPPIDIRYKKCVVKIKSETFFARTDGELWEVEKDGWHIFHTFDMIDGWIVLPEADDE